MEQPVHLSHHRLLDWQQLVKLVGFSHLQTTVSLKGECTLHTHSHTAGIKWVKILDSRNWGII